VISPIGFVSDHMEVLYDLGTEAAAVAAERGVTLLRAPTAGTHPAFVRMIVDLALAGDAPACPAGCCAPVGRPAPAAVR
jgi:ferrochelatase